MSERPVPAKGGAGFFAYSIGACLPILRLVSSVFVIYNKIHMPIDMIMLIDRKGKGSLAHWYIKIGA